MIGGAIPRIGLGTWDLRGSEATRAISSALAIGYRHIDTAQSYGTEGPVGEALAQSGIARDEVFVTTKITGANFGRLAESLRDSLRALRLDQVDLTLIHWPAPHDDPPVSRYMADLARAQDAGLTRLIGVSNFNRRQIDEAIATVGEGRIATNQAEIHPFLQNKVLAAHCAGRGVPMTAYLPIARGAVGQDPVMQRVAQRHGATPEQVSLAFLLARGHVVIPKSADPGRQRSNLAAASLRLTPEDMAEIDRLDCGRRFVDAAWGADWD